MGLPFYSFEEARIVNEMTGTVELTNVSKIIIIITGNKEKKEGGGVGCRIFKRVLG